MPLFGQDDLSQFDPLFFRGKTSVLGEPIEVRVAGELPGEFPAAAPGAAPTPGPAPTPPTAPGFPAFPPFPPFEFGGEMPEPPEFPQIQGQGPTMPTQPGSQNPWWAGVLAGFGKVAEAKKQLDKLTPPPAETGWQLGTEFSLFGPENQPWWAGTNTPFNVANVGLGGPEGLDLFLSTPMEGGPWYGTGEGFNVANVGLTPENQLTVGPAMGGPPALSSAIAPGLQAAAGAYTLATAPPGSPAFVGAIPATIGGGLGTAAALGALGPAFTAAGPVGALLGLPLALGSLYSAFGQSDQPHWPPGYTFIPGSGSKAGAKAVDPSTGAILVYQGNGQFAWSPETQAGQVVTPAQMRQWQIAPTGALAQTPGYSQVSQQIQNDLIAAFYQGTQTPKTDVNPVAGPQAAVPEAVLPPAPVVKKYIEQKMAPEIKKLQAAAPPGTSQGTIWNQFATSPAGQAILQEQALLNPPLPYRFGELG